MCALGQNRTFPQMPVDRGKLLAFLSELYNPHGPIPASAPPTLRPEWEFVLAVEEF